MPVMDKFSLAGTKRLVGLVVKPRPSTRALRLRCVAARQTIAHTQCVLTSLPHSFTADIMDAVTTTHISESEGPLSTDLHVEEIVEDSIAAESLNTSTDSHATDDATKSPTSESPTTPHTNRLRSYRHRQSRSINDAELALLKVKDVPVTRTSHTWPRANTKSIDWALSTCADDNSRSYDSIGVIRPACNGYKEIFEPLELASQVQDHSGTSDYSEYVTAPSHFDETTFTTPGARTDEPQVLQAIDRGSGAVFERVCQGEEGEVDARDAAAVVSYHAFANDVSYHLVPRDWLAHTQIGPYQLSPNVLAPALVLTVPTPIMPQSPVFVPQSPITVSKFFHAASFSPNLDVMPATPQDPEASVSPLHSQGCIAPALMSCGHCGLYEFDQGLQCRACNERWLACKVWYRANDGGKRQFLTEPYIRPGECNERNRTMMRDLGIGRRFDWDDGVDDESMHQPKVRRRLFALLKTKRTRLSDGDEEPVRTKRLAIPALVIKKARAFYAKIAAYWSSNETCQTPRTEHFSLLLSIPGLL